MLGMIGATRRRLRQARFFHGHLVNQHNRRTGLHDPEAFLFYFSAFIQAARSVTWTLGKEENEKWKAWEPKWRASRTEEEQKLLDLTNNLRRDEVHRGGANPIVGLEEVALHELLSANLDVEAWPIANLVTRTHSRRFPGVPPSTASRPAYHFEHEDGKEEVTALCARYLELLEKMINDYCADNYPASPT
jgi:hypothetical protein